MQGKGRVLFISYDGLTDPLGRSQILPYFVGLSSLAYKIHILSFEKANRFEQDKDEILAITKANNIEWHPLRYTSKPPIFSTLYDLYQMYQTANLLHKKYSFSFIHARSYLSALIALEMKKKYSLPFIFYIRGFWADERVEGKIWNIKNPIFNVIYKYFKKKEKQYLLKSDYNISLTDAGIAEIRTWNGFKNIPFEMIPCCADMDLFSFSSYTEFDKKNVRKDLGINNSAFVVSYLGSIGTWYMFDEMLDFFSKLKEKKPDAHFLFISKESEQMLKSIAEKKGILANDISVVAASRNQVPQYLNASDVNLFFIIPTFSKKASSPTKLAEALGMGIPIIANTGVGDVDAIIQTNKLGLLVNNFSSIEFENIINNLDKLNDISKEHLHETANSLFSLEAGVKKYELVYKKLLKE